MENYRPISLSSTNCKIVEHIIGSFINKFLETNSALSEFQHGFHKGLSTTTQLVTTTHEFAQASDSSSQIGLVFLDFSKTFDRMPP